MTDRGPTDPAPDRWSDLSFSPTVSSTDAWWRPGGLPLEEERTSTHAAPLRDHPPRPLEEPRRECLPSLSETAPTERQYTELLRRLDRLETSLLSSPEEPEESSECSWTEFLSEKWRDLLLVALVVFVVILVMAWALRRRHRPPPRRDY